MADELEAMGASAERVDKLRDASHSDEDDTVHVWPDNADAVNVFCRCGWERQSVSDGRTTRLLPTGIGAGEIRHVAELMGVPRARWPRILDDVRRMVATVLPALQRTG